MSTFRLTLFVAGHQAPAAITFHSLRRGGAQACASRGSSIDDIMQLGSWKSNAVPSAVYMPNQTGHFLQSLVKCLGTSSVPSKSLKGPCIVLKFKSED